MCENSSIGSLRETFVLSEKTGLQDHCCEIVRLLQNSNQRNDVFDSCRSHLPLPSRGLSLLPDSGCEEEKNGGWREKYRLGIIQKISRLCYVIIDINADKN